MRTIGITGGIGSGKSYICRLIADNYDIPVFNCDIEAHRLMMTDTALQERLTAVVGDGLFHTEGCLTVVDKAMLADFIFVQKRAEEVNAIVHPAVREWFTTWRNMMARMHNVVVMECAILVESGFADLCSEVWVVTAPESLRIARACQRDKATPEQVMARIRAQIDDTERIKHASLVINNDGTGDLLPLLKEQLPAELFLWV